MTILDQAAACARHDAELWFTDEADGKGRETYDSKKQRLSDIRRAVAICRTCPALAACDRYWQEHPAETKFGIWAGKTARERGHVKRARI